MSYTTSIIESYYKDLISKSLQRFLGLYQKREKIDVELVKLRHFMYATLNMVSDKDKVKWTKEIDGVVQKLTANSASLVDSVRRVFEDQQDDGFSASMIRTMLLEAGFDFSSYTSNPLSSISTTLRRMAEMGELKAGESKEGGTIYFRSKRSRRKIRKTED